MVVLASNMTESSMRNLLGITMTQLVNPLILFMSLGCKAHVWHDPGIAYGFENVTLPNHILLRFSNFLTSRLD
jgi:hypothetical protein